MRVAWWALPVLAVLGVDTFFRVVDVRSTAEMMD